MNVRSVFKSIGELDQLREFARGAALEVAQLGPGVMRGVLAHADLARSSVHMNRFSLPARGRGALSSSRWTFVVFPQDARGRFNCHPLDAGVLLAYPPGKEFEGTIEGRFKDWVFTIESDQLARACEVLSQPCLFSRGSTCHALRAKPRRIDQLRQFASSTLALAEESPHVLHDARIRRSLHDELTDLLARAVLSTSTGTTGRGSHESHWQIVKQAEGLARSMCDRRVRISDLCVETGVSERTLRNAFVNVMGLSPQAYLKTIRLNHVRAELERSNGNRPTVGETAMRWGFFHLGRFSQEYRRFFGELPSETRQRFGQAASSPASVDPEAD